MAVITSLEALGVRRGDQCYPDRMAAYARDIALSRSSDPDTQVGCVAVLGDDVVVADANRLPDGVAPLPERLVRPEKYRWIRHAEDMVVSGAAEAGLSLEGAEVFLTWFSCQECAIKLARSGIHSLHGSAPDMSTPRWGEEFPRAARVLSAAGICMHLEPEIASFDLTQSLRR